MNRTLLVALFSSLLLGSAAHAGPVFYKAAPPAAHSRDVFPLPVDATGGEVQAGDPNIVLFKVSRGRDVVVAEIRKSLDKQGWTIVKDETSGRGAIRLQVKKASTVIGARIVGDSAQSAIILTLP